MTEKKKDVDELKEKIKEGIDKVKKKYDDLPEEKKVYVKYGGITVAGLIVGGIVGYLLGKGNEK